MLLASASPIFAQALVYLSVPPDPSFNVGIKNPSAPVGEESSIPVLGFTGGAALNVSDSIGGVGTAKPTLSGLKLVKAADRTGPSFFKALVEARKIQEMRIRFYRTETTGLVRTQEIILKGVVVTGFDWGGNVQVNGGVRETVTLEFDSIEVDTLSPLGALNSVGYNVKTGASF